MNTETQWAIETCDLVWAHTHLVQASIRAERAATALSALEV